MKEKDVAVVILNWNGSGFLKKFFSSLVENTDPDLAEIYVVDNDSSDDSLDFLSRNFPFINIVKLDKNYGFSAGYNKGLKDIKAKYFLLLNSDILVPKDWLRPLYNLMEENPKIGVCGPKLLSYSENNRFEYAGATGGFIDKYGYPFCRGRIFDTCELDNAQYDSQIECFWVSGAAFMISSELYFKLDGFDEDFFAHQEEIDLCWRVQNLGFKIVCEPRSSVFHVGAGSLPKSNPYKTFLNFRNNLFCIEKNMPSINRRKTKLVRFFLDQVAAIRMVFQGNFGDFFAVIKAYAHFFVYSFKMSRKRVNLRPKSTKYLVGFYNSSIVFDYFLKKKRKFTDLKYFNPPSNPPLLAGGGGGGRKKIQKK